MKDKQNNLRYFDDSLGFGPHKQIALDLLEKTTDILDEFNIKWFLVSGTLLGLERHGDFIPWDDDIDIVADSSILDKIEQINEKYKNDISIANRTYLIKTCFKDKVHNISCLWSKFMLNKGDKYNWPFVDIFIYEERDNHLYFFQKEWEKDKFYPLCRKEFQGIYVYIPKEPSCFLTINYGPDYMTVLQSSPYNHKKEYSNYGKKTLTMDEYMEAIKKTQKKI